MSVKRVVSPLLGIFAFLPIIPARVLARRLLMTDLWANGINPFLLPEPCFNELVDCIVKMARLMAQLRKGSYRYYLVEQSEALAISVHCYTYGEGEEYTVDGIKDQIKRGTIPAIWEILARTNPEAFSLKYLENTQIANRKLRNANKM